MTAKTPTSRTLAFAGVACVVLLGGAAAALYGAVGPSGNSGCAGDRAMFDRLRPLAKGEVAGLSLADTPVKLPDLAFNDAEGKAQSLADFRGRTVLLNLWATWCVPCRQEMPALDRLQTELGGPDFAVAAINIDTRNPERPKAWLAEAGIRNLAYHADPQARVFQDLKQAGKVTGLPTSILIDPKGCEIATLNGAAEWSSPDALALIRAAIIR